jgi:hypothetical protein
VLLSKAYDSSDGPFGWVEDIFCMRANGRVVSVGNVELVRANGIDFFVELADGGGPSTVGYEHAFSFDGVRDAITAIGSKVAEACRHISPDEASVEFGISLTARAGKLTGLLVDGDSSASLKVTLSWKNSDSTPESGAGS